MNDHDHCPVCSAFVNDLEAHGEWHDKIDQAIELAVLQEPVAQSGDGAQQEEGGTL